MFIISPFGGIYAERDYYRNNGFFPKYSLVLTQ